MLLSTVLALFISAAAAHPLQADSTACPASCYGDNSWTSYSSISSIPTCSKPILTDHTNGIRACTLDTPSATTAEDASTTTSENSVLSTAFINIRVQQTIGTSSATDVRNLITNLYQYLSTEAIDNETTQLTVGSSSGVRIGLYSGSNIKKLSAAILVRSSMSRLDLGGFSKAVLQYCGENGLAYRQRMWGMYVDTTGDEAGVSNGVSTWSQAKCLGGTWDKMMIWEGAGVTYLDLDAQ